MKKIPAVVRRIDNTGSNARGLREMFVDRRKSGLASFNDGFAGSHHAPLSLRDDDTVKLHIVIDASSVEVFGNDGESVITDRVFPSPECDGVSTWSEGGVTEVLSLTCHTLRSNRPSGL